MLRLAELTILDLAHTGLDVVEREVAHRVLEAVEIHGADGSRGSWGLVGFPSEWCRGVVESWYQLASLAAPIR
jgi:hypothetical protein